MLAIAPPQLFGSGLKAVVDHLVHDDEDFPFEAGVGRFDELDLNKKLELLESLLAVKGDGQGGFNLCGVEPDDKGGFCCSEDGKEAEYRILQLATIKAVFAAIEYEFEMETDGDGEDYFWRDLIFCTSSTAEDVIEYLFCVLPVESLRKICAYIFSPFLNSNTAKREATSNALRHSRLSSNKYNTSIVRSALGHFRKAVVDDLCKADSYFRQHNEFDEEEFRREVAQIESCTCDTLKIWVNLLSEDFLTFDLGKKSSQSRTKGEDSIERIYEVLPLWKGLDWWRELVDCHMDEAMHDYCSSDDPYCFAGKEERLRGRAASLQDRVSSIIGR